MATRQYEVALGENPDDVDEVVGGAITAAHSVRVTVDLAEATARQQAIEGLEQIKQYILESAWPPA